MATRWIDFAALKKRVPIRDVLARYGLLETLREKSAGKLSGPCPIHKGKGKSQSFHVDCERNIWNCFSECQGGGNTLDLVMKLEGCEIRVAAEKLADWFDLSFSRGEESTEGPESARTPKNGTKGQNKSSRAAQKHRSRNSEASEASASQISRSDINPPLERPLKSLNPDHPYLVKRGLTIPTIKTFGVGHCVRGLMKSRIAIPIHNPSGELIGSAPIPWTLG